MDVVPTVFDQLQRAAALLGRDMSRSLEPLGLTPARMHVLWVVHRLGPQSQQQLAAVLEVTPRNITGLVDALVASGHVTREPHPSDRRAAIVTLTEIGVRLMSASAEQHAAISAELLDAVADADRAAFTRGLDAVLDRLESAVLAAERSSGSSR